MRLVTADVRNTHGSVLDGNGGRDFSLITDWIRLDSPFRTWNLGAVASPIDLANAGKCAAGTCAIRDFRLTQADTVLRNHCGTVVHGEVCPDSVRGDRVISDHQAPSNVFLVNAREVTGDGRGDDDGLCESGEACIFSPNLGPYQGEGDFTTRECLFQDGVVFDVTMYAYPENGR